VVTAIELKGKAGLFIGIVPLTPFHALSRFRKKPLIQQSNYIAAIGGILY